MRHYKNILLLPLILFILSCSGNIDNTKPTEITSIKRGDLVDFHVINKYEEMTEYGIVYYTEDIKKNSIIKVSGYASIPNQNNKDLGIFLFHRGTSGRENPPSKAGFLNTGNDIVDIVIRGLFTSIHDGKLAVIIPDYAGYGVSDAIHPYGTKYIANASIDLLRATKQLFNKLSIKYKNKIYISGYSEGGQATMATHKQIHKHHRDEFNVIASAPQAGPYDPLITVQEAFRDGIENYPSVKNLLYYVFSFIYVYDDKNLLEISLQEPYKSQVRALVDEKRPVGIFDIKFPKDGSKLFKQQFSDDIVSGKIDTNFKKNLIANRVYEWTPPSGSMILYHSLDDELVPYKNSVVARDYFNNNGSVVILQDLLGSHKIAGIVSILTSADWLLGR